MIDSSINNIRNVRENIYKTYTYCMANYTLLAEEDFKKYTDEALKMYDSLEDQLRWFKKKINLFDSNDDSTDIPDTDLPNDNNDNSNNTNIDLDDIELLGYTDEFKVVTSKYEYEVKYEKEDGILDDKIQIPIKTQNLQNFNLKVVSNSNS